MVVKSRRYAVVGLVAVAGLIWSGLFPETHVHCQRTAGGGRVATMHRHAAAHDDAAETAHGTGTSFEQPHSPDAVVWMGQDVATVDSARLTFAPAVTALLENVPPEPMQAWEHVAPHGAGLIHDPPRLLLSSRAPPRLS